MKNLDLFGNEVESALIVDENPMCRAFGVLEGEKCKNCLHYLRLQYGKVYLKCALRRNTHGAATDIKANWNACKKFVPQKFVPQKTA